MRAQGTSAASSTFKAASNDTDLVETGMLDSLALVSFILELETSFGLSVSYDNLEIDNFRTVKTISQFVQQTMIQ